MYVVDGGKRYPLFMVGYSADGGFFITDLVGDGDYLIVKTRAPQEYQNKIGTFFVPAVEQWHTAHHPKLSHHIDGSVHVSGTGKITSGFFPFTKTPKGVSNRSFDLRTCNHDGGPSITFAVWGLDKLVAPSIDDGLCFTDYEQFDNPFDPPIGDKGYAIEGYYYP